MMDVEKICRVKENLCDNLIEYADSRDMTPQDIETVKNLASGILKLYDLCDKADEESGSQRGGSYRRGSYRRGSYDDGGNGGNSYRDGYSNDNGGGNGGSYHGDREWMIRELDKARSYASGDREREIIRKVMQELRG